MTAKPAWKLVIHGGAGVIERGQLDAGAGPRRSAPRSTGRSPPARRSSPRRRARSTRSRRRPACSRTIPISTPGAARSSPIRARTSSTRRSWTAASRDAGAVTGVTATRNPISLARAVMEHSPHVFLSREGADQFSREQGLEQAGPNGSRPPERRRQLEEMRSDDGHYFDEELKYGTVGAVAVDVHGHVAAATSTGGLTGKRWGRIGDSPLIGAGTYADDRAGAVSATGAGEYFIRAGVAHEICARMRMLGESAAVAADTVIADVGALGGSGGVILVTPGRRRLGVQHAGNVSRHRLGGRAAGSRSTPTNRTCLPAAKRWGGGPAEAWWRGSWTGLRNYPSTAASRGPPPHLRWGGNSLIPAPPSPRGGSAPRRSRRSRGPRAAPCPS